MLRRGGTAHNGADVHCTTGHSLPFLLLGDSRVLLGSPTPSNKPLARPPAAYLPPFSSCDRRNCRPKPSKNWHVSRYSDALLTSSLPLRHPVIHQKGKLTREGGVSKGRFFRFEAMAKVCGRSVVVQSAHLRRVR